MHLASETAASVAFGRFRVLPHRRQLLADGQPIKLGGRAFDMLMALIDARGEVVSKDALMARVWPDRVVAEKNLHTQISALRTALGAERELIHTVPGDRHQFTGESRILQAAPDERAAAEQAAAHPRSAVPSTNLPEPGFGAGWPGRGAERDPQPCGRTSARELDRRRRHQQDTPRPRGRAPAAAAICRPGLGHRTPRDGAASTSMTTP
jgi:DNA-binding winged helix-turn-helix (wHTH) protein